MAFHAISSSLLNKEKNSEDRICLYLEYSHSCEESVCASQLFSHFEGEKKMSDKKQLLLLAWGIWPRDESSFISMWLAVWWVSESFGLSWHRCWDQSTADDRIVQFLSPPTYPKSSSQQFQIATAIINHLIFNLGDVLLILTWRYHCKFISILHVWAGAAGLAYRRDLRWWINSGGAAFMSWQRSINAGQRF